MARYTVVKNWHETDRHGTVAIEACDIVDTRNGQTYRNGAYRVTKGGKPFKVGKGGTVPHIGELAWAAAERDFNDLIFAARFAS